MSEFLAQRETFGLNREARYERFMAAINAARGAFRNDKAVMAELDRFARVNRRSRRSKEEAEAA